MSQKVAVYAGYFDPFTLGHLNIVTRATRVFERVVVAVAKDSPKESLFSFEERSSMVQEVLKDYPTVEIDAFSGLLVEYLRARGTNILLRGLRSVSDFEYEYQMTLANRRLAKEVETFFMFTEEQFAFLSSTLIKEIARLGGDIRSMVPENVERATRLKYATQRKS